MYFCILFAFLLNHVVSVSFLLQQGGSSVPLSRQKYLMGACNIAFFLLMFQLMKTITFTVAPQERAALYYLDIPITDSPSATTIRVMEACHISLSLISKNEPGL